MGYSKPVERLTPVQATGTGLGRTLKLGRCPVALAAVALTGWATAAAALLLM